MKKRAGIIPVFFSILVLLGGCINLLDPPGGGGSVPGGKGRLAINIEEGARTALPSGTFEKYVLRFVYAGAEGYTYDDVEWSGGTTVDLEPGAWTVYLDAYSGGAVSGTGNAAVTVSAGTVTPVTLRIGVNADAGVKGTLKYKVSYPPAGAGHAYNTQTLTVRDAAGSLVQGPVNITNGAEGSLELEAGIYFAGVLIEDTVQRTGAARTSAAHIYGGKETYLEFTITEEEFTALVPVTVSADLTIPGGVTLGARKVGAYGDALCTSILGTANTTAQAGHAELTLWTPSASNVVYIRQEIVIGGVTLEGQTATVNITDPEQAVTASLSDTAYKVNIAAPITGGTVAADKSAAFQGNPVIVTVTNGDDGVLKSGTVKFNDGVTDSILTGPPYNFTMPASEVTVSAEFNQFVRYVTEGGIGDGKSWETASEDVQKMMDELEDLSITGIPGYTGPYIVKLGAGTYKPQYEPMIPTTPGAYAYNDTPGDLRDRAFILREGVQVWGGYPASGGIDTDRNITVNVTTLSGDFNGDDVPVTDGDGYLTAINNAAENAYHVVLAVDIPVNSGTVLDGLKITGGNADSLGYLTVGTASIPRFYAGGVYAANGSFAMTGGTISGNQALQGGGGALVDGTFTMTGGTISGNIAGTTVNGYGGGVCVDGTFIMKGTASVSGNVAVYHGGGVYVGGSFTMEGTASVSGNIAKGNVSMSVSGDGGGVYVEAGGAFTMSGGTISNNTAGTIFGGKGGGIYITGTTTSLVMNGGEISGNTATSGSGGGVYNASSSPVLTNVTISDNTATSGNGGGMFNSNSSPALNNVTISGNEAGGGSGGGMYNSGSSPVLTNVTISDNTATDGNGGGMFNGGSSLVLTGVTISDNTATSGLGGGMYNQSSSLALTGVTISGNTATNGSGGGMYNTSSSPVLINVTISGNTTTSSSGGGGMYNHTNSSPVLTNVTISGNSAPGVGSNGGGMYNFSNSSPVLTNVTISGNSATGLGGRGGGMYNYMSSSPALTNVIISGNTAASLGGGIANNMSSSPTLTNVTIAGNSVLSGNGGGMGNYSTSSPQVRNSIIWGNTANSNPSVYNDSGSAPIFAHSIVQDSFTSGSWDNGKAGTELSGYAGTNKEENPLFVTTTIPTAPTIVGDYCLQTGSPAIDEGDNDLYPNTWVKWQIEIGASGAISTEAKYDDYIAPYITKDLAGNDRIQGTEIDIGAYEKE